MKEGGQATARWPQIDLSTATQERRLRLFNSLINFESVSKFLSFCHTTFILLHQGHALCTSLPLVLMSARRWLVLKADESSSAKILKLVSTATTGYYSEHCLHEPFTKFWQYEELHVSQGCCLFSVWRWCDVNGKLTTRIQCGVVSRSLKSLVSVLQLKTIRKGVVYLSCKWSSFIVFVLSLIYNVKKSYDCYVVKLLKYVINIQSVYHIYLLFIILYLIILFCLFSAYP